MDAVNKYICTFEPGYQSRNYDKNNYNLIILNTSRTILEILFSLERLNYGTLYRLMSNPPIL